MRQPLVIANWKMHGERASNGALIAAMLENLQPGHAECAVCPPHTYLDQVGQLLQESAVRLGGQDCSHARDGAYTGEISASMLVDCGCDWVLIGHSERRQYHQESDSLAAAKLVAARNSGLVPVLCVGETQDQRESGNAELVVSSQLTAALGELQGLENVVVAYEPVWAIGTGLTASPEQAQEMHAHIRSVLASIDSESGGHQRILYGGSVKPDNAPALFGQADIDGALVGGASLDATSFAAIVNAAGKG